MAFAQLEPFGFHAQWAPFAHLLAMLANVHRDPKKSRRYKAEDFMPKEPTDREMGDEQMKLMAKAITEMFGGRVRSSARKGSDVHAR